MYMQPPSPKKRKRYISHKPFVEYLDSLSNDKPVSKETINIIDNYYVKHCSPYFYTVFNIAERQKGDNSIFENEYEKWKDEHEFILDSLENETLKPKEKVNIDCKLESTDDILKLLKNNPYDETKAYNIDLRSLHKVKDELECLNKMVGLEKLKVCILKQLLYFIQGFANNDDNLRFVDYKHTIFVGPPGTGKTEVAKIIGKMYSKLGILKNNTFKKVTRTDLIAGYLGQTAIKTRKVIDECIGGVLFIDEAYSLQYNDSYAKECVDTLCEALSDCKQDLLVIVAGYENELNESLFKINTGLKSRFLWKFKMEAYDSKELANIFVTKIKEQKWSISFEKLLHWIQERKDKFIYNGRDMEQLFTYVKIAHSHRIYGLDESVKKIITLSDMNEGYESFLENRKDEKSVNMHTMYI